MKKAYIPSNLVSAKKKRKEEIRQDNLDRLLIRIQVLVEDYCQTYHINAKTRRGRRVVVVKII